MNERAAGRLELAGARARRLLGVASPKQGTGPHEGAEAAGSPPNENDAKLLAARIAGESSLEEAAATALARDIVARAQTALGKVLESTSSTALTEEEALALESVIHVRGRPALRIIDDRLEALDRHPGSEFWQNFISDCEDGMIAAAGVTGAAFVTSFTSGFPPWIQGSAWLIRPDRVVTNRHVLMPAAQGINLLEPAGPGNFRLREDYKITIDFTHDDRTRGTRMQRSVKSVLYISKPEDPVDIAVLEIEPFEAAIPLHLCDSAARGNNFYVIGHPGAITNPAAEVKAVFANLDGKKRVSFGKRLNLTETSGDLAHDASTVGGFSGAPVVKISNAEVSGLHYYGDPVAGNLAVTAVAIRAHEAFQHFAEGLG